jgi:hypothetical protein
MEKKVLQEITNHYLDSRDFNGILISNLGDDFEETKSILAQLLNEDKIVLNFGDRHPNPHILAFEPEPKEEQLKKLEALKFEEPIYEEYGPLKMQTNSINCCAYPSKQHLKKVVDTAKYQNRPFSLLLALGEPQLSYKAFNLRILEFYRNDPRYSYETDDIHGSISAESENQLSGSDDTFLETFGFAYDKEIKNRYVAAYSVYLSRLTPEHQQRWNLEMFNGETFLHPDYARATAGHWQEKESIFNAFCEEMRIVNEMTMKIAGKSLFRKTYDRYNKPKKFSFLVRPTKEEYENFLHLLDKMLSENLNKDFFKDKIQLTSRIEKDSRLIEQSKGTIQLLEEWLNRSVKFPDPKPKDEMISIFKEVRSGRSEPAHHVREDAFDSAYFAKQRDLIRKAYQGIRTLRLIFANHPLVKQVEVPEWLYKGDIWTF